MLNISPFSLKTRTAVPYRYLRYCRYTAAQPFGAFGLAPGKMTMPRRSGSRRCRDEFESGHSRMVCIQLYDVCTEIDSAQFSKYITALIRSDRSARPAPGDKDNDKSNVISRTRIFCNSPCVYMSLYGRRVSSISRWPTTATSECGSWSRYIWLHSVRQYQ